MKKLRREKERGLFLSSSSFFLPFFLFLFCFAFAKIKNCHGFKKYNSVLSAVLSLFASFCFCSPPRLVVAGHRRRRRRGRQRP